MYLMDLELWVSVVILNMSCINGIAIREEIYFTFELLHIQLKAASIFRTLTYFRNKIHLIPFIPVNKKP